jgi:hypothetical protein
MKSFALLGFLFVFAVSLSAQTTDPGKVTMKFDRGIETLVNAYSVSASEEKTEGFRVQLCSESGNNARGIANSIKANFLRQWDGIPAYLVWESPNFKVRVGDFKNRLDATLFWKQILENFPQAYVVTDEVNMLKFD